MRASILALAGFLLAPHGAEAAQDTARYTAFDLAAGILTVRAIPDGAAIGKGLASHNCASKIVDGVLTIRRTIDLKCRALFDARQPQDLGFDVTIAAGQATATIGIPLPFDTGLRDLASARYDASNHQLDIHSAGVNGTLTYHSELTNGWAVLDVAKGIATLASGDDVTPDTTIYLKTGYSDDVVAVKWSPKGPPVAVPEPPDFSTTCKMQMAVARTYAWSSYVDAANATASLEVKTYPPIIEPNSFGLVVVRHAEQYSVTFDSGAASLTNPSLRDGVSQAGADRTPAISKAEPPKLKYVCSTQQVPPHAPGTFQVKIKVIDPLKGASNAISERSLDVIVLQRFSGAFRAGVAGVFGAPDQKFESRTAPGSTQAEIVRTAFSPVELALGYSVYFSSLYGTGRSYFTKEGKPGQDSYLGLYFGVGVVSFTSSSVDYLKSLHLGLDIEFSQYFAIALTGVLRRVDELAAGAQVGGPVGTAIPTQSRYVPGAAVVLNISPSFFRFATQIGK